jgi:hypothetical protein
MILGDEGQEIKDKTAPGAGTAGAFMPGDMAAAGFPVKNQIPLNSPLIKGDFKTPL